MDKNIKKINEFKIDNDIDLETKIDILLKKHHEETAFLSDLNIVRNNENFQKMIKMGHPIIPILIKKIQTKDNLYIIYLIAIILGNECPKVSRDSKYVEKYKAIMEWWEINKTNYGR